MRGSGMSSMDLSNKMKIEIDGRVPRYIRVDFMWEDIPFLRMLRGIPLDVLASGGRGSLVSQESFDQLRSMTREVVDAGLFPTDLKPANVVVVEVFEEDCIYWDSGHELKTGRRVFFIDAGQFVLINKRMNKMCGDGVVSLFREMYAYDNVSNAIMRDAVGKRCLDEALATLEGSQPHSTARLRLKPLVEAIMVGIAGSLGINYRGDTSRLRAPSPVLELVVGGEGLVN